MFKSHFFAALSLTLVSIVAAAAAVWMTDLNYPRRSGGQLLWAGLNDSPAAADRIEIIPGEGEKITLVQEDNFWLVKEADYYFADSTLVNLMFENFLNSAVLRRRTEALPEGPQLSVSLFAGNRRIDNVQFYQPEKGSEYYSATKGPGAEAWLVSGNYRLPPEVFSWLIQPLFEYPEKLIESITVDNHGEIQTASRKDASLPFFYDNKPAVNLSALLETFNLFITTGVQSAQNFDEKAFPHRRNYSITTFSGLITKIELLYNDQNQYRVRISLSSAPLSTRGVKDYISDNSFLYDGWFFEIPAAAGQLLANFIIR